MNDLQKVNIEFCGIDLEGWADLNDRWNGFIKPYLNRENADKVLKLINEYHFKWGGDDFMFWGWEDRLFIVDTELMETIEVPNHVGDIVKGERVWYFNLAWVFCAVSEDRSEFA